MKNQPNSLALKTIDMPWSLDVKRDNLVLIWDQSRFHFHHSWIVIIHHMELSSKKQNQIVDTNSNTYGVVITVYTESVTARSRRILEDPSKKTKARPYFRSHGYDRRALLLAHSQKLRNVGSQNVPLLTNQPRPKPKSKVIIFLSQCQFTEMIK